MNIDADILNADWPKRTDDVDIDDIDIDTDDLQAVVDQTARTISGLSDLDVEALFFELCGGKGGTAGPCPMGKSPASKGRVIHGYVIHVPGEFRHATKKDAARLAELKVPPGWTNVILNEDPTMAGIQAMGKDAADRTQYRRLAGVLEKNAAENFARLRDFHKELPALRAAMVRDMNDTRLPEKERESAAIAYLIDKTAFRIGSEKDTRAEVQAYGASTLEAQHVTIDGDEVHFSFVGKKGVDIEKTVKDAALAKMLAPRVKAGGQLFKFATDSNVRDYFKTRDDGHTPKDFRTTQATAMALRELQSIPPTSDPKALKRVQKEIATKVAAHLGNRPAEALKSYINPAVWDRWRAGGRLGKHLFDGPVSEQFDLIIDVYDQLAAEPTDDELIADFVSTLDYVGEVRPWLEVPETDLTPDEPGGEDLPDDSFDDDVTSLSDAEVDQLFFELCGGKGGTAGPCPGQATGKGGSSKGGLRTALQSAQSTDEVMQVIGDRLKRVVELEKKAQSNTLTDAADAVARTAAAAHGMDYWNSAVRSLIPNELAARDAAYAEKSAAWAVMERELAEVNTELQDALRVGNPGHITARQVDPGLAKTFSRAAEQMSALTTANLDIRGVTLLKRTKDTLGYYENGVISVAKKTDVKLMLHEMAHAIETQNPEIVKIADALIRRSGVRLDSVEDGMQSKDRDGFVTNYSTKLYRGGRHSELFSTGMEWYVTHPARLARDYPNHFRYMFEVMRRAR